MALLSIVPVRMGQVGFQPNTYKMVTTDSLATITTAGYFQQYTDGVFLANNDIVETIYLARTLAPLNTLLKVAVDASTGLVTFSLQTTFDLGTVANKAPTNVANPVVASIAFTPSAPGVGKTATFTDSNGTIGFNAQSFTAKKVAIAGGSTVYGVFDTSCTPESVILAMTIASVNPAFIIDIIPGSSNFSLAYNTNPGVGQLGYLIINRQ